MKFLSDSIKERTTSLICSANASNSVVTGWKMKTPKSLNGIS